MKLTELLLNRFLYKDNLQNLETKDSSYNAGNVIEAEVPAIASGGAAQDINTSNVTINGQQLTPGTYPVTVLDVSNWGWGQTCAFTSADLDTVTWGAGVFTSASGVTYNILAGTTGNMAAKTYIYLDILVSLTTYQITTTPANSVGVGKVLVAVAQNATAGNLATYNLSEATQIVGDNILANSINASKITTGQLIVGTNVGLGTAIATGGAAADVNSNFTSIIGGRIRTGNIESTGYAYTSGNYSDAGMQINLDNGVIRSPHFAVDSSGNAYFDGDITAAGGTIGGWSINSTSIYTGTEDHSGYTTNAGDITIYSNGTDASIHAKNFYIDSGGNLYATSATIGAGSAWTGNQIAAAYIGDLSAAKITSGTITIGGTSQPGQLTIIQSTAGGGGTTTAKLNWTSSTGTERGKIWADSSGYMGYNAIGGRHYFYTNDTENMVLQDGAQAIFQTGISCRDAFNITSGNNARIAGGLFYFGSTGTTEAIYGTAGTAMEYNANTYHYWNVGGNNELRLSSVGLTSYGYFYSPNSEIIYLGAYTLDMNGTNKTAIVPTKNGYTSLYCAESPEVWFFDFCEKKDMLDPIFEEVTVGPYKYIKCEDGGYQVWGKRKGHEKLRFEMKDKEDFDANERFLNINKRGIPLKVAKQLP